MSKKVYLALTGVCVLLAGLLLLALWFIMVPGLSQLNSLLPLIIGILFTIPVIILLVSLFTVVLAASGVRLPFFAHAFKLINIFFPTVTKRLGRVFKFNKMDVMQSFISLNNDLVKSKIQKVPADRILILTPHCIQFDKCPHKITRNVENCKQCGGCKVGDLLSISERYGCKLLVATGGTLARQMVAEMRPKAIVAVACERDLASGILDVFPIPVIGVYNERPYGPCFNTTASVEKIEDAVREFMQ